MSAARQLDRRRTGLSQWQYDADRANGPRATNVISPVVSQWEREHSPAWRKKLGVALETVRRSFKAFALAGFLFTLGFAVASGPDSVAANVRLSQQLNDAQAALTAREGELELAKMELARVSAVMTNSQRYSIPADLAASIYDIAVAEGIDPGVAYSLVNVESEFYNKAVSPVGALGLTQVMPATGRMLQPGLERADLFDPETNLRLGFRFLREMLARYDGDLDLALHAYNRGPGVVDRILRTGGDPANGYAAAVRKGAGQSAP
ncbi:MAG TPA: lytic transglycosylase domain-containing protein [Longimicrobiales bacterium]